MTDQLDMLSPSALISSLRAFTTSPSSFRILHTSRLSSPSPISSPKTLYILDSSFNPPTLAHLRICLSALRNDVRARSGSRRLLLLLAIQNADKPPKPAAFEQRLSMMGLLAEEVQRSLAVERKGPRDLDQGVELVPVDVGVCKPPLFVDKICAIEESREYGEGEVEQAHLIGFDTLLRLLDPTYYPDHTLRPLSVLFENHRVRATKRTEDQWGLENEQDDYMRRLSDGKMEDEGWKRQWADRIDLVDGRGAGEEMISSTKVRDAAQRDDQEELQKLVPHEIAEWILRSRLYGDGS